MFGLAPYRLLSLSIFMLLSVPLSANIVKLDLSQAIERALQQNHLLAAERMGIQTASSQLKQIDASFWPKVTASSGFVRTNSALDVFGLKLLQKNVASADFDPTSLNNPDYYSNLQTRFDVSAVLYQGGARSAAKQRAAQSLQAAKMAVEARKQSLFYDVTLAYARVFQFKERVSAAEKSYKAAQKHLKTTQALQRKGVVINSDVMDTNVHRLNAEIALTQAKNMLSQSLDQLRYFLNIPTKTELQLSQPPKLNDLNWNTQQLIHWAENNRPDLLALQHQQQASRASVDERKAAFKPSVSVQLSKQWNSENFAIENDNTSVAAQLSWNIYAGGADTAALDGAKAEQRKLQYLIKDKRYAIRNDVMNAARLLNESIQRQHVKQQAEQQSKEALRIRSLRHAQGLEKTSDLLASQAQLDVSRADAIRATYNVILAKAALLLTAGKLTQEDIH